MRVSEYIKPIKLQLPANCPPILVVVVDTEEEFDWGRPHNRTSVSVESIRDIARVQNIFDEYRVRPTYVVDYPIASQSLSVSVLREIYQSGRAEIGVHLHPWVSPPYDEEVNSYNSYPGNLSRQLEEEKLKTLRHVIETAFELKPKIYKAGRYGIGPNTVSILADLGFEVDLSLAPPFDYSDDGGPNFTDVSPEPSWLRDVGAILSLPTTGAYIGFLRRYGAAIHSTAACPMAKRMHVIGILSRSGALNHVRLSPEQYSFRELRSLTKTLLSSGIRVLSFSFHSPSVRPGCTPYVRNPQDLERFLDDIRKYLHHFTCELNGVGLTPLQVRKMLLTGTAPSAIAEHGLVKASMDHDLLH